MLASNNIIIYNISSLNHIRFKFNNLFLLFIFKSINLVIKNLFSIIFKVVRMYLNYKFLLAKTNKFLYELYNLQYDLKKNHKRINLTSLKKKLLVKFSKLRLEKLIFNSIGIPITLNIKNVFNIFKVRKKLKIPKKALL